MAAASEIIEKVALDDSSSVFVYDLAEHAGFGQFTKELQLGSTKDGVKNVFSLQTRAGAGLSLVGRLSDEGTSTNTQKDSVLSAYTTPSGLSVMAPSFAYLPEPTASSRIVIQVPAITPVGPTLEFSPTLAPLNTVLASLPESFTVLLSSSPQESVDLASAAYRITNSHVIHFFDHHGATREIGHKIITPSLVMKPGAIGVRDVLQDLSYSFFDFVGDEDAEHVLVALNGSLASAAQSFVKNNKGLGLLVVRVLRPWDAATFLDCLPASAKMVYVLDEVSTEGTQGALYTDVFTSFLGARAGKPSVYAQRLVPTRVQELVKSPSSLIAFLESLVPQLKLNSTPDDVSKKIILFGTPASSLAALADEVTNLFVANKSIDVQSLTEHDVFSKPGGVVATRVTLSPSSTSKDYTPIKTRLALGGGRKESDADLVVVGDQGLLKTHDVVIPLKPRSSLLVFTSWTAAELVTNLASDLKANVREKGVVLYNVNTKALDLDVASLNIVAQLVFLRLYLGQGANEATLKKLALSIFPKEHFPLDKLNAKAWAALELVHIPLEENLEETSTSLRTFEFNAVKPEIQVDQGSLPGSHLSTWHDAARHILFPDAFVATAEQTEEEFPPDPALRPEVPERTFLVTCSVNRRLTPLDYDRNVFHLEFDTSGTGLKYEIGEALGVHGWNDADEILQFCDWYGVDPNRLITIPVPGTEDQVHTRTIFQALQQQIDLFGKPPKGFYAELASHATHKNDNLTLQFIGSPEGSSMFKKLSEKDTVTFADVLLQYKSARPSIEVLCELVGDIKPRHYSIASAQSVVGNRVDLLVVTVEWQTPSGSPRFGQCTRYLAGLKVGQKVTVSIKPSVMKLPPSDLQPLILAGLGTGAAPFRAFLQHRAHLASQKIPVGPLFYYFGSRYRSKEYLYGEEIEAFILDETITKAGLAFSRDGKKKVYIQHKMVEDAEDLARMLGEEKGVFYLCGPTWPVPDVYEALVKALVRYRGMDEKDAGDYLEGLKEEERYVLEVY